MKGLEGFSLPWDSEAESSVIGAALLGGKKAVAACHGVSPSDFYRPANGTIWAAVQGVLERGEPLDIVTLKGELEAQGVLEEVGGLAYLMSLGDFVPSPGNAAAYARAVLECSKRRQGMEQADRLFWGLADRALDADETIAEGVARLSATAHVGAIAEGDLRSDVEEALRQIGEEQFLPTGIDRLDEILGGGFFPSTLIVIGARPSVGKTALTIQFALEAAKHGRVLYLSLEMPKASIIRRMISTLSRVPLTRFKRGVETQDAPKLAEAARRLVASKVGIVDQRSETLSMGRIAAIAAHRAAQEGVSAVFVDFLQLIPRDRGKWETERIFISDCARRMAQLSKVIAAPVILCSQLTRNAEGKEPDMDDLRESGAIEEAADVILMMHPVSRRELTDTTDLLIRKNRDGPIGSVRTTFFKATGRFEQV